MQSGGLGNLLLFALPLLLLGVMFVSQRRRSREVQALQGQLAPGDEVLTSSGIYATVVALDGQVATLEVSAGVRIRVDRRAILRRVDDSPAPPAAAQNVESSEADPTPDEGR